MERQCRSFEAVYIVWERSRIIRSFPCSTCPMDCYCLCSTVVKKRALNGNPFRKETENNLGKKQKIMKLTIKKLMFVKL